VDRAEIPVKVKPGFIQVGGRRDEFPFQFTQQHLVDMAASNV
jgi:hypothetical protein